MSKDNLSFRLLPVEYVIQAKNLSKLYKVGDSEVKALNGVSFNIKQGELAVILGPSGAGKTTLLNLLGGMDTITSGELIVDKEDVSKFDKKALTYYRRNKIGFVFQFYNLMPNLTALENIELATELKSDALSPAKTLEMVGLKERKDNFPAQLSGGEQQRVSIARALAKNPSFILCDEPTGALDYQTGKDILKLLQDAAVKENKTVLIVTHNSSLKEMANHLLTIKNGEIIEDKYNQNPKDIKDIEW